MERGLKIPQNERTKTTNSLLISLMKQLEKVFAFSPFLNDYLFWKMGFFIICFINWFYLVSEKTEENNCKTLVCCHCLILGTKILIDSDFQLL